METVTRLRLQYEVNETLAAIVSKAKHEDPHSPIDQELQVTAVLHDTWSRQLSAAMAEINRTGVSFFGFWEAKPTTEQVMAVFNKHFSPAAVTKDLPTQLIGPISEGFMKGRATVDAGFHRDTGSHPMRKDVQFGATVGFGQLFGLTEDHALQALLDQLVVSAGGFWEEQLSDSIKNEIQGYFDSSTSRDELVGKIQGMVNSRLKIGGKSSLPTSYFDNLATHQIVRSRNVGAYYRAKSLRATHYTLVNPRDTRTSPICRKVTNGEVFTMAGAEGTVSGILTASSVADLRAAAPFYKDGDTVVHPVPPLHFPKCRTWMNFVFEGLG